MRFCRLPEYACYMGTQTRTIHLTEQSFERLDAVAKRREVSVDSLVAQAVAVLLADDAEALAEFEEGIQQIEAGNFYTHEQVRAQMDALTRKLTAV